MAYVPPHRRRQDAHQEPPASSSRRSASGNSSIAFAQAARGREAQRKGANDLLVLRAEIAEDLSEGQLEHCAEVLRKLLRSPSPNIVVLQNVPTQLQALLKQKGVPIRERIPGCCFLVKSGKENSFRLHYDSEDSLGYCAVEFYDKESRLCELAIINACEQLPSALRFPHSNVLVVG